MKINLKGMKRKELEKLAADVEKALAQMKQDDKKAALQAAKKAAETHGFSLDELVGAPAKAGPKKPGKKVPPKYRNPKNPAETWTGRGRRPRWVEEVTKGGKDISEFLIAS